MGAESILSETYFGSTILQYILFFGIVAVGAVVGRALGFLYHRRLKQTAHATETELDDIILHALGGPVVLLGVILGIAVGRNVLTPSDPVGSVLDTAVNLPVIVTIAWLAVRLTDGVIEVYAGRYTDHSESKLDDALVPIVSRVTNVAIVSIAGIVILDSIGYDVTAIIASLGIVGVAVAFASRKTMADVFGGAHILSTKPFLVGDAVEIEGTSGTVEAIGIRTTQLRDFDGRLITIPNSAIADAEVRNISSEPVRRVITYLGLSYETSPAEMEAAIDLAAESAGSVDGVDQEQTDAWFWDYGDATMQLRLEYYITDLDRWKEIRDTVNRVLQERFDEAAIAVGLSQEAVTVTSDNP
ncbi:MAG: mechanosensitive ion channel family protein [Halapricum sp.]